MKKVFLRNKQIFRIRFVAFMLATCLPAAAAGQTYTWTGGAALVEFFSAGDNWDVTPEASQNNRHLVFGASARYRAEQDIGGLRFLTFTFGLDAGDSYHITGYDDIQVQNQGRIVNNSRFTHTLEAPLNYLGSEFTVNARRGDLVLSGYASSVDNVMLIKEGVGSLYIEGDQSPVNHLVIRGGEVVLDVNAGAALAPGANVTASANWGSGARGGGLRVIGSESGSTTVSLGTFNLHNTYMGPFQIVVDSNGGTGTTLEFTTFTVDPNWQAVGSLMHIDLSSPGSVLKANLAASSESGTSGINRVVAVTQGGKTGFGMTDGSGNVVRFAAFDGALPSGATAINQAHNYTISGHVTRTANAHYFSSLTITGAGSFSNSAAYTSPKALLMEEGVGDFEFLTRYYASTEQFLIHQYSLDGTLYLRAGMGVATAGSNNSRVVTGGPGTIVVEGNSDGLGNTMRIGNGRFQNDSSFGWASAVTVANGATLSGSGNFGKAGMRLTPVTVYGGGTLDGTRNDAKALTIYGSLILEQDSIYYVNLVEQPVVPYDALHVTRNNASTVLTIAGDLHLVLSYNPDLHEKIVLLTWDTGTRTGEFATINGHDFYGDDEDLFILSYAGYDYEFRLVYNNLDGEIYLETTVVPEPATVALLFGVVGLVGLYYRRRKRLA